MEEDKIKEISKIFFPCEKCTRLKLEVLWLEHGELYLRCSDCGNIQVVECNVAFKESDLVDTLEEEK